jgi:hypothetical protein
MPTFTFTNNNRRFQAYLYWVTQSGVLEGGLALPSELTRTYVLDLPAGTEIRFTTHLEGWVDMSAPSGQGYFRDNGITFDTYRTTGAGHQTHTLRNISTQLSIRNRSASPIFLFKVDPHSGNDVAAGSLVPNEERQVSYDL